MKCVGSQLRAAAALCFDWASEEDSTRKAEQQAASVHAESGAELHALVASRHYDEVLAAVKSMSPSALRARLCLPGGVQETVLHACYLYSWPSARGVAHALMDAWPDLTRLPYGFLADAAIRCDSRVAPYLPKLSRPVPPSPYQGETVLHMAVASGDLEEVRYLVARFPHLLHGRATGKFFDPAGKMNFGELPLSFAVCTNAGEIAEVLVKAGASLLAEDGNGNTALHMAVLHDRLEMYDLLVTLWRKGYGRGEEGEAGIPPWERPNRRGLTPLALAASLGKDRAFQHIWLSQAVREWTWGNVTADLLPLVGVDGVSHLLTEGSGASHLADACPALHAMVETGVLSTLSLPPVQRLLARKWARFARRRFLRTFVLHLGFLALFTLSAILRSTRTASLPGLAVAVAFLSGDPRLIDRIDTLTTYAAVTDMTLVTVCIAVLGATAARVLGARATRTSAALGFTAWHLRRYMVAVSAALVLVAVVLEAAAGGPQPITSLMLSASTIAAFGALLLFFLGSVVTGPFVVYIHTVLIGDIARFLALAATFVTAFSMASFVFDETVHPDEATGAGKAEGLDGLLYHMWVFVNGMFSPEVPDAIGVAGTLAEGLSLRWLFGLRYIYLLAAPIILVNLLVAMMGTSFSLVSDQAEARWRLQWARVILAIEEGMTVPSRVAAPNVYYVMVKGRPFLYTEQADDSVYASEDRCKAVRDVAARIADEESAAPEAATQSRKRRHSRARKDE